MAASEVTGDGSPGTDYTTAFTTDFPNIYYDLSGQAFTSYATKIDIQACLSYTDHPTIPALDLNFQLEFYDCAF